MTGPSESPCKWLATRRPNSECRYSGWILSRDIFWADDYCLLRYELMSVNTRCRLLCSMQILWLLTTRVSADFHCSSSVHTTGGQRLFVRLCVLCLWGRIIIAGPLPNVEPVAVVLCYVRSSNKLINKIHSLRWIYRSQKNARNVRGKTCF